MFSPVGFDHLGRCQVAAVLTGLQSTYKSDPWSCWHSRSSLKEKRVTSLFPLSLALTLVPEGYATMGLSANWQDVSDMGSGRYGQRTEYEPSAGRVTLGMSQTPVGGLSFAEK